MSRETGCRSVARWAFLLAVPLLLSACAPAPVATRLRFLWPPGSERPRVEYLRFYQVEQDLQDPGEGRLEAAIFGREEAAAAFKQPHDIASDGRGRIFVSDAGLHQVLVFDRVRAELRSLKTVEGGPQGFVFPGGLTAGADGRVYAVESRPGKVLVFGADEKLEAEFGKGQLERPTGIAVDSARGRLYVVDTGAHRIAVFGLDGALLRTIGERGTAPGMFNYPLDAELDAEGNLYVVDSMNARIQVFDEGGDFLRAFGEMGTAAGSFQLAKAIAVSRSGHVYVTDSRAHKVVIFDLEGNHLLSFGGYSVSRGSEVAPGGLNLPQGIDVDAGGAIWVVDSLNGMFHQFQYLNDEYLKAHPILPGQVYLPADFRRQ